MKKRMGILPVNGIVKDSKKQINGHVNGSGKRKAEDSSDSEEDSKSKLVTKSTSKKIVSAMEPTPKKKNSSELKVHSAISETIITTVEQSSPTQPKARSPSAISKPTPMSPNINLKPLELQSKDRGCAAGPQQASDTPVSRTEKNRRKREKKRERQKLKKLAEKQSQGT